MDEEQAIALLRKHIKEDSVYEKVLSHSEAVKEVAVKIAQEIKDNGHTVDIEFVKIGSLLHDIGREGYPPKTKEAVMHGVAGAEILRKEGFPKYALVCERHLGAGITKEDVEKQKLPLTKKDYVPVTVEEKIISYADLLIEKDTVITISHVIRRFRDEIGEAYVQKIINMHNEIEALRGRTSTATL